jgi:hypothetical protein
MNRDETPPPPEPRLQFWLRDILIIQAVCAVFCGLLVVAGVLAVLAAFIATLLYASISVGRANVALKRWVVSLLGGVVLPCLCLVYDPIVFRPGAAEKLQPGAGDYFTASHLEQAFVYLVLGFQMLALLAWLLLGSRMGWWAGLLAGTLYVGALVALLIGVALLPVSLLGLIAALIGLLGCTPFLTAGVYLSNGTRALRLAKASGSPRLATGLAWLGAALAVAVPGAVYYLAGEVLSRAIQSIAWPESWPFGKVISWMFISGHNGGWG